MIKCFLFHYILKNVPNYNSYILIWLSKRQIACIYHYMPKFYVATYFYIQYLGIHICRLPINNVIDITKFSNIVNIQIMLTIKAYFLILEIKV